MGNIAGNKAVVSPNLIMIMFHNEHLTTEYLKKSFPCFFFLSGYAAGGKPPSMADPSVASVCPSISTGIFCAMIIIHYKAYT